MKNNVLKLVKYLYYFSFLALLIIYFFPGSLIGFFFYGDMGKQPNIINNPIGTSINHLLFFMYLTTLAVICNLKQTQTFTNLYFIFFVSVILEILHSIIPNRAFELYDLIANSTGVILIFLISKLIKW